MVVKPLAQLVDLTVVKKRRRKATRQRCNPACARLCIHSARESLNGLWQWTRLIFYAKTYRAGLNTRVSSSIGKINLIADDACDFCSSKRRKLISGQIVNEAKHNLCRYKTAVTHCYNRYRVKYVDRSFDLGGNSILTICQPNIIRLFLDGRKCS